MDKFVETQLKLCNCDKYIPLFKKQGINEEQYRKLGLSGLVELIPPEDEVSIMAICGNIVQLKSSTCIDAVKIKVEPSCSVFDQLDNNNNEDGDDDEVQVIQVVRRAPTNLAFWPSSSSISIKTEPADDAVTNDPVPVTLGNNPGQTPQRIKLEVEDITGNNQIPDTVSPSFDYDEAETQVMAGVEDDNGVEMETNSNNTEETYYEYEYVDASDKRQIIPYADLVSLDSVVAEIQQNAESQLLNEEGNEYETDSNVIENIEESCEYENEHDDASGKGLNNPIKRRNDEPEVPLASTSGNKRARETCIFLEESDLFSTAPRKSNRKVPLPSESQLNFIPVIENDKKSNLTQLRFEFHNLSELDSFLQQLRVHGSGPGFKNIEKLKIVGLNKNVYVGQPQLEQISSIHPSFLSQLKCIVFGFGFYEDIDPQWITTLLSACTNLQIFTVRRGIFGKESQDLISIEIPQMSNLIKFNWGKSYAVSFLTFPNAPIELNLEEENHPLEFEIDFSNHFFPNLKEIKLGHHPTLNFEDFSQFPQLSKLMTTRPCTHFYIDQFGFSLSMNELILPEGITDPNIISSIPTCFPNISALQVFLPSVATLRTLIRVMSSTKLAKLLITVDYDFDDALISALKDLPYRLASSADVKKLSELRKYKYWKQLSKHLGIELPEEELEDDATAKLLLTRRSTQQIIDAAHTGGRLGLGSFKHLQILAIRLFNKSIRLPKNDLHWTNPKVQYALEEWSTSGLHDFPMSRELLVEFGKLKPTLQALKLWNCRVIPEDLVKFQQLMGFKPNLHYYSELPKLDCVSGQKQLVTNTSIKQ